MLLVSDSCRTLSVPDSCRTLSVPGSCGTLSVPDSCGTLSVQIHAGLKTVPDSCGAGMPYQGHYLKQSLEDFQAKLDQKLCIMMALQQLCATCAFTYRPWSLLQHQWNCKQFRNKWFVLGTNAEWFEQVLIKNGTFGPIWEWAFWPWFQILHFWHLWNFIVIQREREREKFLVEINVQFN